MDAKTIGLIFVAILVAYFIMSPYRSCVRTYGENAVGRCAEITSW